VPELVEVGLLLPVSLELVDYRQVQVKEFDEEVLTKMK